MLSQASRLPRYVGVKSNQYNSLWSTLVSLGQLRQLRNLSPVSALTLPPPAPDHAISGLGEERKVLRCAPSTNRRLGVFGGSFNPVHLGHTLLAVATCKTMQLDEVLLVPVFKHAVKDDLLPFEDRVRMCELAVEGFSGVTVSRVEEQTKQSNAVMLRALRALHPGSDLFWICGDDVFDWIEGPRGLDMLQELSGLVVQRRLHAFSSSLDDTSDSFFKQPIDDEYIRTFRSKHEINVHFTAGELPHFSSTLVRSTASWRPFLPTQVAQYLAERPDLQRRLGCSSPQSSMVELHATSAETDIVTWSVARAVELVHMLQRERGRSAFAGALGACGRAYQIIAEAHADTDCVLQQLTPQPAETLDCMTIGLAEREAACLAEELGRTGQWLSAYRRLASDQLERTDAIEAWEVRAALITKYSTRIEVLIAQCVQVLSVYTRAKRRNRSLVEHFEQWARAKENFGQLRGLVIAGGPHACGIVRTSLRMRRIVNLAIEKKDRAFDEVLQDARHHAVTPHTVLAVQKMLERVSLMERDLLGSFAPTTSLSVVHQLAMKPVEPCNVEHWYTYGSEVMNVMLSIVQGLAAHCAR